MTVVTNITMKVSVLRMDAVAENVNALTTFSVFSKLDAECGFHQILLSEDSQKLTTFINPFGRYCYTRLPFGITSAPEIFQRRMSEVSSRSRRCRCDN